MDTVGTDAINLGTQAAAKTITIGNNASAKVDINAIAIELDSADTIVTDSVTTTAFTSGTTMTLSSGGILAMDTVGTDAINLGTQAAAKTITIGNDASAKVDVNAIDIELDSSGTIVTDSVTTTAFTSGTTMTFSSGGILAMDTVGTDAINIGIEAQAKTITIGNDASAKVDVNALAIELDSAGTIVTDSVTSTAFTSGTTMTLSSGGILEMDTVGTDEIRIGKAAAKTITIGNDASAKVDVNALAIELDSAGTILTDSVTSTAFTSGTTMTLSSGGILEMDTVGTEEIRIGKEAAAKTITIGNDASAKVDVNALAIELDSAGTIVTDSVTSTAFTSGTTMTLSSGGILEMDTVGTDAINIGIEAQAKTITIGNDASAKVDVNALAIELDSAGTIVTDSVTTTAFTSGTTMTLSSGGILEMDTVGTDEIRIGKEAAAKTITIGNDASAKVDVNALAIELDSAGTIVTDSVTSTAFTSGTTMTLSSGGILEMDTVGTEEIRIGKEAAAKTITIGNDASAKVDVNALAIELDAGSTGMTLSSVGTLAMDTVGTAAINLGTQTTAKTITIEQMNPLK